MEKVLTNSLDFTGAKEFSVPVATLSAQCGTHHFDGAFILPDGRVVEKYCVNGFMYQSLVFANKNEWQAINHDSSTFKRTRVIDIQTGG